jgi:hypothetical protein
MTVRTLQGKLATVKIRDGRPVVIVDGQEQWLAPGESVVIESFTGSEIIATIGEDFTAIRDESDQFSR